MAVAFMAALEKAPETYDQEFDRVLDGRATRIRENILELVKPEMRVLDLGCGPGRFALEASKKGASVVAVDADENMIAIAKSKAVSYENPPEFIHLDVLRMGEDIDKQRNASGVSHKGDYDLIVSTFLLSELKTSERHLFMHIIKHLLKEDGIFAIAAETLPQKRSDRRMFWRNRRTAEKEAGKRLSSPIVDLGHIAEVLGLEIIRNEFYGPEITMIVGTKGEPDFSSPNINLKLKFHGPKARVRIWYNHLSGSWRGMPIQPGLYKVGNPGPESIVIVTANYELTYYTVMRTLAKDSIDAWVLVCDTAGINVWCAARGIHFDSDDVIHMIRLTGLHDVVNHREMILPQLAAAGMNPTMIRERTGFRVRYGPVRIQDLAKWMKLERPRPKPKEMATVTFNLRERMEMTVAHIPFLFAALLWIPIATLVTGLLAINVILFLALPSIFTFAVPISLSIVAILLQFVLALFGNAFTLGLIFPILPSKGNSFLRRGVGLAGITLPLAAVIMILLAVPWTVFVSWLTVQFILSITLTMDFAGMSSVSDPKVIRMESPLMLVTLIVGSIFIIGFNIIAFVIGW